MSTATARDWTHLDRKTREELDEQYLTELHTLGEPGLTDEGIEAYLAYRHERPELCMTTFELGQIHRLHLTNAQTYVWIMLVLILVAMVVFVVLLV